MSLIRDPATITKVGRQMMTAGGDITYTKATLYGQDISHLTKDQLESLTSIGNPLMTVPVGISDKSDNGNGTTIVLEATFQNTNLKTDLPYTAVGFFAKKGNDDEKLVLVGVANPGTYLVATPPDGIATDAADIKAAIAIGDATSVTAVVDPAGSVTPATLNSAINNLNHDITAKIDANQDSTNKALDTKADKTIVADQLATKANQSDLDKTNAEVIKKADSADVTAQLDTKADKTDVANSVKQLQSSIDSKADKSVVDAEIAKIDFTPYAKTADVTAQINAVSDEIATKVGADYSYSKAQLDEKLLALSTDTNGKVSADQVTALIADKANKADVDKSFKAVNDSLATKADQATTYSKTDVDKLLSAKDDTTDVDAKIKTVTGLANTKASQDSLNKLSQTVDTKADKSDTYTKAEVDSKVTDAKNTAQASTDHLNIVKADKSNTYTKAEVDSRVNEAKSTAQSSDNQIWGAVNQIMPDKNCPELPDGFDLNSRFTGWRRSPNKSLKNMPSGWTTDSMYFQGAIDNNDGLFELALNVGFNTNDCPRLAYRIYAWGNWKPWKTIANDEDIASLQTQINNNDKATITTGFDWNSAIPTNETRSIQNAWLVDQQVFGGAVDRMNNLQNQINSKLNYYYVGDGYDVLSSDGKWGIIESNNAQNLKNIPAMGNKTWVHMLKLERDGWGVVIVYSQDNTIWQNVKNGDTWTGWSRLANALDVTNLQNQINTLQNQVNDLINQINYIKQNYLQGKRFPANQEAQAEQWENANPNGIAMIEK